MIKVGQRLHDERVKKNLSLEEVSKATKIRASFLSAIEKGDYNKLPSSAYVYGFIRNYAEYLGMPTKSIVALFKREFDEEKELKVLPQGLSKGDFPVKGLRLRQIPILIILIFIFFLGYIFFQYKDAFISAPVEIKSPPENSVINSNSVTILGKTDPNVSVYINNTAVPLDTDGRFRKDIEVFSGKSSIQIKVVNRFGKQTVILRHIEVKSD